MFAEKQRTTNQFEHEFLCSCFPCLLTRLTIHKKERVFSKRDLTYEYVDSPLKFVGVIDDGVDSLTSVLFI